MELGIIIAAIILIIAAFFVGKRFASKPINDENNRIKKECAELEKQRQNLTNNIQELQQMTETQEKERRKSLDDLDSQLS